MKGGCKALTYFQRRVRLLLACRLPYHIVAKFSLHICRLFIVYHSKMKIVYWKEMKISDSCNTAVWLVSKVQGRFTRWSVSILSYRGPWGCLISSKVTSQHKSTLMRIFRERNSEICMSLHFSRLRQLPLFGLLNNVVKALWMTLQQAVMRAFLPPCRLWSKDPLFSLQAVTTFAY